MAFALEEALTSTIGTAGGMAGDTTENTKP